MPGDVDVADAVSENDDDGTEVLLTLLLPEDVLNTLFS